jgi:acetoin utilization deacetylase AcuC-like enzyme
VTRSSLPALCRGAIEEPEPVPVEALQLVHGPAYVASILDGTLDPVAARRLGFPWTPELRERSLHTVQGTIEAAHDALARGAGMNLAGGTHHAFADRGEGFCVFNDVAGRGPFPPAFRDGTQRRDRRFGRTSRERDRQPLRE